jgi:anti-sigma-K factor RskA
MAASEPVPASCGNLRRAVWYSVTASAAGTLGATVTATSGGYQPVVAIYSNQGGVPNELACADTYKGQVNVARALAGVSAGQTYLIRVGGEAGQTGTFRLELGIPQ